MGNFITVFAPSLANNSSYQVVGLLVMFPSNTYMLTPEDRKPVWHQSYMFGIRTYDVLGSNCAHIFNDVEKKLVTPCDPSYSQEFVGRYSAAEVRPWTFVQEFPSRYNPYGHIGVLFNVKEGVFVIDNTPRFNDRMVPFDQKEHVPTRRVQMNGGLILTHNHNQ